MTRFELQALEDYSDESLVAEIRRVAELMNGQSLTRERFNAVARVHTSTLENRFGSWRAALDLAGISETAAPRRKSVTRAEVLSEIRAYSSDNDGVSPTVAAIAQRLGTLCAHCQFGKGSESGGPN
jgi:hypothetical protein